MEKYKQLHFNLTQNFNLQDPRDRRGIVIGKMDFLEKKSIHCFNCPGTCCTSVANSMQISPLEALEILLNLEEYLVNEEKKRILIDQLNKTILLYRLDKEIYTGKKNQSSLRKNYTCPFFNFGTRGCSLSRGHKPYGCLGFNPNKENDNGQTCRSEVDLLESRDHIFHDAEKLSNAFLRNKWNLQWDKKSIPEALLEIIQKADNEC